MRHQIWNRGSSFVGIVAAVLAVGVLVTSAQAITLTSSLDGIIFQDTLENDTVGQLPTISGSDVGSGYTKLDGDGGGGLTLVRADPDGELGKVLGLFNDASDNGVMNLDFPAVTAGAVLEATVMAKVGDVGSLGVGFTHAICGGGSPPCSGTDAGDYVTLWGHYIVLMDAGNLGPPPGYNDDDLIVAYYDGSWNIVGAGGGTFKVDDGVNQWVEVRLTQTASAGSYPLFTINGTALDPTGYGISPYDPINGLRIRQNNTHGQSYVGAPAPPAEVGGLTITSSGALVFRETFTDDILGALPTIGSGDVGTSYTKTDNSSVSITDIENDAELGKVLNIANNGAANGSINLDFPAQPVGSLMVAKFRVKIVGHPTNGGSIGVGFTQGICGGSSPPCPDDPTDYVTLLGIYNLLITGNWYGNSWPGIAADDVVLAYYNGSQYNILGVGGDPAAGRVVGGAGKWIDVVLTQSSSNGASPVFTLNGTQLDPIPYGIPAASPTIDGLRFRHNGPPLPSTSFVGGMPAPTVGTVILIN